MSNSSTNSPINFLPAGTPLPEDQMDTGRRVSVITHLSAAEVKDEYSPTILEEYSEFLTSKEGRKLPKYKCFIRAFSDSLEFLRQTLVNRHKTLLETDSREPTSQHFLISYSAPGITPTNTDERKWSVAPMYDELIDTLPKAPGVKMEIYPFLINGMGNVPCRFSTMFIFNRSPKPIRVPKPVKVVEDEDPVAYVEESKKPE